MFLVLVAVVVFTYHLWDYTSTVRTTIPGPRSWPIIGNYHLLLTSRDPRQMFLGLRKKYGDLVYLTFGKQPVVLSFGFEMNEKVLVVNKEKTKNRPMWLEGFVKNLYREANVDEGEGVVFSNGQSWSNGRKFTISALREVGVGSVSVEDKIQNEIDNLVGYLLDKKGEPVSVCSLLTKVSSNVITSVISGKRYDYTDKILDDILESFHYVIDNNLPLRPETFFPFIRLFRPTNEMILHHFEKIKSLISSLIEEERKTYSDKVTRHFIDLYLKEAKRGNTNVSEQFLFYTISDLFFAGTDTTAVVMQWCMLFLIKYPNIQERCRDEIMKTIGTRSPKVSDRVNLPYTNATLHEIQRKQTPIPIAVPHGTYEDCSIDGQMIPKHTILLCDLETVHMDPKIWTEPEKFQPERFLDDDGKFVLRKGFCPFSLGPRQCLGKQLAEAELFLVLVTLVQKFYLIKAYDDQKLSLTGYQTFATYNPENFDVKFQPII